LSELRTRYKQDKIYVPSMLASSIYAAGRCEIGVNAVTL
jgi:hypothetical protein